MNKKYPQLPIGNEYLIVSGSIAREVINIWNKVVVSIGQIAIEDIPFNTIFKH
tara:strand:+ start:233 stop:391 length:159 start_codon:yes stop_codon:yes gene_type:complete